MEKFIFHKFTAEEVFPSELSQQPHAGTSNQAGTSQQNILHHPIVTPLRIRRHRHRSNTTSDDEWSVVDEPRNKRQRQMLNVSASDSGIETLAVSPKVPREKTQQEVVIEGYQTDGKNIYMNRIHRGCLKSESFTCCLRPLPTIQQLQGLLKLLWTFDTASLTGAERSLCPLESCDKRYQNNATLSREHFLAKHLGKRAMCPYCAPQKTLIQPNSLILHCRLSHASLIDLKNNGQSFVRNCAYLEEN